MSIMDRKLKYYGKRVFGLKGYAYFWSWFVVATNVFMIVFMAMHWTDEYSVPLVTYCVHTLWALTGALTIALCDKPAFYINVPLLAANCIVSLYIQTMVVTDTPAWDVLGFFLGTRNTSVANIVVAAIESTTHDIVFFMSAVMLVLFIYRRDFFLAETSELKQAYKRESELNEEFA